MATGQQTGAHGKTRRNHLPRVGSLEGNLKRSQIRAQNQPKLTGKYRDGTTKAGSRNPRKVGRG